MRRRSLLTAAVAVLVALLPACSDDDDTGVAPGDALPPSVVSSSPANGDTDLNLIPQIEISFSEPMDASTINDTTITLIASNVRTRSTALTVEYDPDHQTAICIPDSTLAAQTTYQVACSTAISDAGGNALAAPWSIIFDTGPLDCEHLGDRLEENDSIEEAVAVEWDVWYPCLSDCGQDGDVFEFTLEDTAKVVVHSVLEASDGPSWRQELLRQDGAAHDFSSTRTYIDHDYYLRHTLLPGTYYVRLMGEETTTYLLYGFQLQQDEPCADDPYEDNDFYDEATMIAAGHFEDLRACRYDYDHFALDAVAGQLLTVTVTAGTVDGNRGLRIKPQGLPTIAYYHGTDDPMTLQGPIGNTGIHYVVVYFSSDGVVYDMDVTLTE